jgi:hypothetical protein
MINGITIFSKMNPFTSRIPMDRDNHTAFDFGISDTYHVYNNVFATNTTANWNKAYTNTPVHNTSFRDARSPLQEPLSAT